MTGDALRDRSVVVTGGGTGIGRATALAFAAEGARVLVVGRSKDTLAETAGQHPSIRLCAEDIAAPGAVDRIVDVAARELGGLDVLVNNAVTMRSAPLGRVAEDGARAQVETNLLAPLFLTQRALPLLEAAKGLVINVTTAGNQRGWPGHSVYGATKAGLDFLTRTWALELAPRGIRVAGVSPGPVDTPIGQHSGLDTDAVAALRARQRARVPLGRVGRPDEVAWWLVNLARPEASFATGLIIAVDGGASVVF
ncbi:SDR family NAD(P)-dependent oxidoreductase [Actinacidiphila rubida]|uniref:NAD(P)-dependent dehydrogenase, short-chain alcohol dehydrogenase family n=1 Tax=Actinacidiphila rubida TaxID=310780 RepID=A0A1H8EFX7_9ACTN|nr:SDR family oxidoreductase [Actinacidiphila rubida]SEN18392.1 NAD(P)-dependent dehydrogenase, short-chain alcohol dehydrogenase family [Actinacidiphila rubida]